MWKATKIELTKNIETTHRNRFYFDEGYTLTIDGELISNCITEDFRLLEPNEFRVWVCDFCGYSCDAGDYLTIVRKEKSLLFIPCFSEMDDRYKERDSSDANGDYGEYYCPPHKWYESGILEVDETILPVFLELLSGFKLDDIPFITDSQMEKVKEWEKLVIEKPKDFMRL